MLFVIHGFYHDNVAELRAQHINAHKKFLGSAATYGVELVMSGPLVTDDGITPIGSLIVIDAPDRATAEAFHHDDPFYTAGMWPVTTLTAFNRLT